MTKNDNANNDNHPNCSICTALLLLLSYYANWRQHDDISLTFPAALPPIKYSDRNCTRPAARDCHPWRYCRNTSSCLIVDVDLLLSS